ncbi:MAG TPA: site-2 protease family protein [Terriglobales bacterium]|nr:site-2 protease family protein [Terriglobales bacterium]
MRSWSVPLGRMGNVHVRIHLSYGFLLVAVWMMEGQTLGQAVFSRGFAFIALLLLSVILHEVAHAFVSHGHSLPQRVLILMPIGGVTLMEENAMQLKDPIGRVKVALVGPLVHLFLAAGAYVFAAAVMPQAHVLAPPFITSANLVRTFFWMNLFLSVLHVMPAYPTDGGRVLRAQLARKMNPVQATRKAVSVGQLFSIVLMFAGFWNTWYMIAGSLLFLSAMLEERSVVFQSVLESLRLEEVMLTDFSTLSPADTLEDALSKAVHTLQEDFPVIRGSDMVGVISRQRIVEALRAEGNGYVQMAMERAFQVAQKGESLASGLRKLAGQNLSIIPIVDDGRLVGIVTFQNLMNSMRLLAESRKLKRISEQDA